jgi:hypothetical protein
LPAVYTLSSGAQTALKSVHCLLQEPPNQMPTRFISGHDTWLRQRVVTGEGGSGSNKYPAYCVSSPVPPTGGDANSSGYYDTCVDSQNQATGTWVKDDGTPATSVNPIGESGTNGYTGVGPADRRYGLIFVNDEGRMETLNPNMDSTVPITGSCWMSLVP